MVQETTNGWISTYFPSEHAPFLRQSITSIGIIGVRGSLYGKKFLVFVIQPFILVTEKYFLDFFPKHCKNMVNPHE